MRQSRMRYQCCTGQLEKVMRGKGCCDDWELCYYKRFQVGVLDIACRDQQQFERLVGEQEGVDEVSILGDHDASITYRDGVDLGIRRMISLRQIQGVERIVPHFAQPIGQSAGELSIDQELHAGIQLVPNWLDPFDLAQPSSEGEHSQQIIALQILIIGQDLVDCHAGAQELQ